MNLFDEIEREIEQLRRRYSLFLRETPETRQLPARWLVSSGSLHWTVVLEGVLEPDVDVEIGDDLLVVRAIRSEAPAAVAIERGVLVALLPVPSGFDARRPSIRFGDGLLEIRVFRLEERAR